MNNQGLITSMNAIREMSVEQNTAYHQYVPILTEDTDIGTFGTPILNNPEVMNEFMNRLMNRIVYTQFMTKYFRNPLQILEGDRIPLGYAGQEIYVNPAKGRQFNVNDFAGLLVKYESDIKVQYTSVNMDLQYPVTVSRHKLKQAFVSWDSLNDFITELSNSLYNGAYIDEYQFTKMLISSAYKQNMAPIQVISAPTTRAQGRAFTEALRLNFLNFQSPSSQYNAWAKIGGYGRPIITWSNPEDIVVIIRNDIRAFLDVEVLAMSFNMEKSELLGRIISVDNFNQYDDNGNLLFDGSNILGFIGDASWFRIKRQDMYLDEFYNANNRTWQYYLNLTKMYNYSLFANGVIIATANPVVNITSMEFNVASVTLNEVGDDVTVHVITNPYTGNAEITYENGDDDSVVTIDKIDNKTIKLTAVGSGDATITAKVGDNVTATLSVTVPEIA